MRNSVRPPGKSVLSSARQMGKSAALGAMYGTGVQPNMIQTAARDIYRDFAKPPDHPLQYVSGFQFVERDKRLGGVATYRVATKIVSEIMSSRGERVPHTEVWYRMLDELHSQLPNNVAAIAWIRRSKRDDLEQAVATLLMLGKEPVLVRAFKTDKE